MRLFTASLRRSHILCRFVVAMLAGLAATACGSGDDYSDPSVEFALKRSGDNREELVKVLRHYENEPEKLAAARWLISNMVGRFSYEGEQLDSIERLYGTLQRKKLNFMFDSAQIAPWRRFSFLQLARKSDLLNIDSDYLIDNIDRAYAMWKERPWNNGLEFEDFCELLLPYGIGDERCTSWREPYYSRYGKVLDSLYNGDDALEAARILIDEFNKDYWCYNEQIITPHRDATALLHSRVGYNRDVCDKLLYIMRSCGVPAAIDQLLVQTTRPDSHMWLVVRDNLTGRYIPCGVDSMMPSREHPAFVDHTKGKVFRQQFGRDSVQLANIRNIRSLPLRYNNPYMRDVSREYFGHDSITVDVYTEPDEKIYLGMWATRRWNLIDVGYPDGKGHVTFRDIEPGAMFAPVIIDNDVCIPCGDAFYLDLDYNPVILKPDSSAVQRVELNRTMALYGVHLRRLSDEAIGGRIEISPTPDFTTAFTLGEVTDTIFTSSIIYRVPPEYSGWNYLRYTAPANRRLCLNELTAYADDSMMRPYSARVIDRVAYPFQPEMLTDRNYSTVYTAPPGDRTVTLNMSNGKQPVRIIKYVPRIDKFFVEEGRTYELFYFDGNRSAEVMSGLDTAVKLPSDTTSETRTMSALGWRSLGTQRAGKDAVIRFVTPANALLMMRSADSMQPGQSFIYRNSQVFSSDISRAMSRRHYHYGKEHAGDDN